LCKPGNFIAACNGEQFLFFKGMPTVEDIEAATEEPISDDWIIIDASKPYMKDMFSPEPSEESVEKAYAEAVTTLASKTSSIKTSGSYSANWTVPAAEAANASALRSWWAKLYQSEDAQSDDDGYGGLPPEIKVHSSAVASEDEAYDIAEKNAKKWDWSYAVKCTDKDAWVVVAWVPE
jgi:hypothetical protein